MRPRPAKLLADKRVTVMGLGVHGGGISDVRWLLRNGAIVTITDLKPERLFTRSIQPLRRRSRDRVRFRFGTHDLKDFVHADLVLQNPAVPSTSPYLLAARRAGVPIENGASIFFRYCSAPIIGVTGTKGKTTTSHLIAAMLRAAGRRAHLVGVEDRPVLEELDRVRRGDWIVFELSSWRIERLSELGFSPAVGVLTNVLRDHLDRYPSFRAYARTKADLFRHQRRREVAVINHDDPLCREIGTRTRRRLYWFGFRRFSGTGASITAEGTIVIQTGSRTIAVARRNELRLAGGHNLMNILAAVAAAAAVRLRPVAIRRALRSFRGLPHRLELVRIRRGVRFVNDSSATMPDATIAALNAIEGPILLIAGGSDKRLKFDELARILPRRVRCLTLLPGDASIQIARRLKGKGLRPIRVRTMDEAVREAAAVARRDETILLSPGAASFASFADEFERGRSFRAAVRKLR